MVTLYSSIGIIGLLIFLFVFINYQNQNIKKQELEENINTITQFQIFTDQYILDKIHTIVTKSIFQDNIYELNIIEDSWIYKYNPSDFTNVLHIQKYLSSLASNAEFIDSITIYNKEHDTYISSKTGVFYNVTKNKDQYLNLVNYNLLDSIQHQDSNQFWISPAENIDYYKNKTIMSFVQLTPIFVPANKTNIIISINLDINKIFQGFFSRTNVQKDNFKIIDNKHNVLFDTDTHNLLYPNKQIQLLDIIKTTHTGYEKIKKDGNIQNIIWLPSKINSWKYIYTTDDNNILTTIFSSLGYIFIWGLIIIIVVLGAILFIGKWLYKPLKNLVELSRKKGLMEIQPDGDITTIHQAFSSIDTKLNQLKGVVEKNDVLILNNIIINLINSKINTLEELNNRLKILNKKFINNSFYILLIKIDSTFYHKFNYEEKELIHITINEILDNYYNTSKEGILKMATIFDYEGYFTCIINTNKKNYDKELIQAKELLKILNKQFTSIFNFAITNPFNDLKKCREYYQNAMDYFKYSFIYDNGNIFTEDLILEYEQKSTNFNKDILQDFETCLKTQKLDLLKENMKLLFTQIRIHGYSYLYMYNLSIQLISLISKECNSQNISDPQLSQHHLLNSYAKIQNLDECISWFHEIIDRFIENIHIRNNNINNTLIGDIINYIKGNVDSQLSLNSVADHFNLSTGHLSRLFKEITGTKFSDFVITVKFEKAAKMLTGDTKIKVADIAEQLGYSNLNYFTKLFKERYGMTPTQYRKLNN